MRDLNSMYLSEMENFFESIGEKKFRAKQLFNFFNKNKETDIDKISVFSDSLKEKIKGYDITTARIIREFKSSDGTIKFLIEFKDGNIVETVFMPYEDRNTICISSQLGCKMGCKFCASTKANFIRNLKASEILLQFYLIENYVKQPINNIVIMGIGEPLDNYDEVTRFINLITDENGRNLSKRSITLSTSGLSDKIIKLADDGYKINLAISLHYPFDEQREEFMPVNKKYKINDIINASNYYFDKTSRRVSLEYIVIKNLNDSNKHLEELARIARENGFHINLIPLNEIDEFNYKSSEYSHIKEVENKLVNLGANATIRNKRGLDIDAACGQLRIKYGR